MTEHAEGDGEGTVRKNPERFSTELKKKVNEIQTIFYHVAYL